MWKLFKIRRNEEYLLYESEVKEGKNNRFAHFKINEFKLCNGLPKQPIFIRLYSDNSTSIIG